MPEYKCIKPRHYYNFSPLELEEALLDYLKKHNIKVPSGSATACDGYAQNPEKNCGYGRLASVVLFIQED